MIIQNLQPAKQRWVVRRRFRYFSMRSHWTSSCSLLPRVACVSSYLQAFVVSCIAAATAKAWLSARFSLSSSADVVRHWPSALPYHVLCPNASYNFKTSCIIGSTSSGSSLLFLFPLRRFSLVNWNPHKCIWQLLRLILSLTVAVLFRLRYTR